MMETIKEAIAQYRARGITNFVPLRIAPNGDKVGIKGVSYDDYWDKPMPEELVNEWLEKGYYDECLSIMCGAINNGFVAIDIDEKTERAKKIVENAIKKGFIVEETKDGYHIEARMTIEIPHWEKRGVFEFLGTKRLCIVAPSKDKKLIGYDSIANLPVLPVDNDFYKRFCKMAGDKPEKEKNPRISTLIKEGVKEGDRNASSYAIARQFKRAGVPQRDAIDFMVNIWNPRNDPPETTEKIIAQVNSAYHPNAPESNGQYRLSNSAYIVHTPEGFEKHTVVDDKEKTRYIYHGQFIPKKKLIIDGNCFFEVEAKERIFGDMDMIIRRLKAQGGVLSRQDLADSVDCIISNTPLEVEVGHATYGVYVDDNGKLSYCYNPYFITDSQKALEKQMKKALKNQLTMESIQQYIDMLLHWELYEILPSMGYGVMTSFAFALKMTYDMLIPPLFHEAPESRLGKSLVGKIFTQYLFGIQSDSHQTLTSSYRYSETMDKVCGSMVIDECASLNWNGSLGEFVKQSAENGMQSIRGRADLSSQRYYNRLTPIFTGNGFPITDPITMLRIFKIDYNVSAKRKRHEKDSKKTVDTKKNKLKPIGVRLVELELEDINYDIAELKKRIDEHANKIVDVCPEASDRKEGWGFMYEGLKAWGRVCKQYGINWTEPDYQIFVDKVVKPIENSSFESVIVPYQDLIEWFGNYKTTKKGIDELGTLWLEKDFEITYEDGKKADARYDVISYTILKEYNKQNPETKISSLPELRKAIASDLGIRIDLMKETFNVGLASQYKTMKGVALIHFSLAQSKIVDFQLKSDKKDGEQENPKEEEDKYRI